MIADEVLRTKTVLTPSKVSKKIDLVTFTVIYIKYENSKEYNLNKLCWIYPSQAIGNDKKIVCVCVCVWFELSSSHEKNGNNLWSICCRL